MRNPKNIRNISLVNVNTASSGFTIDMKTEMKPAAKVLQAQAKKMMFHDIDTGAPALGAMMAEANARQEP